MNEEHPMTATSPTTAEYTASPNRVLSAPNGIDYAYRDVGEGTPPLVLLQHFRGNLDNWDPALIDALATGRRGVGDAGSTGAPGRGERSAAGQHPGHPVRRRGVRIDGELVLDLEFFNA